MKQTLTSQDICVMVSQTITGLARFVHDGLCDELEAVRLARAGYSLIASGCTSSATFPGNTLASYLASGQQTDGGWSDVEETLWCLGYLSAFGNSYQSELSRGIEWLESVQLPSGAWGRSNRDRPRIPITASVAIFAPTTIGDAGLRWLAKQWEADLSGPTQLTYKGAFFLLAQAHSRASRDNDLVNRTVTYLTSEQEEDGGFGPWKGHPAGSDPWSTGVTLWGLSKVKDLVSRRTIEQALSWLQSTQLPNGLWPYHYLDDGTAMALTGISSVLTVPRGQ